MPYWPSDDVDTLDDLTWRNTTTKILVGLRRQEQRLNAFTQSAASTASSVLPGGWQPANSQDQAMLAVPEPKTLEAPTLPAWDDLVSQWMPKPAALPGGWQAADGSEPTPSRALSGAATAVPGAMPEAPSGAAAAAASAPAIPTSTAPQDLRSYARQKAQSLGINPDVAERVANTEGGFDNPVRQNMEGAPAYGPYQLYIGGPGRPGLGDEAIARGIDPRRPENARAAVDFALEHAAKNGWGAFQGAAANGIGHWDGIGRGSSQTPTAAAGETSSSGPTPAKPGAYSPGSYTPNQIDAATSEGLDYETALAVCGPAAAIAFARKNGRNPSMGEALSLAKQVGWTVGAGMAGPASEQSLLKSMGVAARLQDGVPDWGTVAADVQRGNPVIISTPGHYFVAEQYDPQTGKFNFGNSAAILKAAGGQTWFTPEEMAKLGMGAPRASLFMDSPTSPTPSVVAGTSSAPTTQTAPTGRSGTDTSNVSSTPSQEILILDNGLHQGASGQMRVTRQQWEQMDQRFWKIVGTEQGTLPVASVPQAAPATTTATGPSTTMSTTQTPTGSSSADGSLMLRQPLTVPTPGDAFPTEDASPPGASSPSQAPPWEQQPPSPAVPGAGAFQDDATQNGQVSPWTTQNGSQSISSVDPLLSTTGQSPSVGLQTGSSTFDANTSAAAPMAQQIPNEDQTAYPLPDYRTPASPLVLQNNDSPTNVSPDPSNPDTYGVGAPSSPYDAGQAASMEPQATRFSGPTETQRAISSIPARSTGLLGEGTRPQSERDAANAFGLEASGQTAPPINLGGIPASDLAMGGMVEQLDRMHQIQERAAAYYAAEGKTDKTNGMVAVRDPKWRAAYPDLAQEYDDLQVQVALNVGGQVGDVHAAGVSGPSIVERAQPIAQRAADVLDQGVQRGREIVSDIGTNLRENAGRVAALDAERAPALANALPTVESGPATNAAIAAAPVRGAVGAVTGGVSGGVAGYESAPEDATPEERAAYTLAGAGAGAVAGATIAGAGTLAAGRLVDSLVQSGRLDPRVLATHPKTADRVRALFSLAAEGLPDDAVVPAPAMVDAMVRMKPQIARQVTDLLSGPVTAGQVRQIVGVADSPGVVQTMQEMAVDALTGLGARGRRGRELAADAATVRGIAQEVGRAPALRGAESAPTLATGYGPARLATPEASPNLTGFVDEIADNLGVARPGVYVAPSSAINAAATVDKGAPALVITQGLLKAGLTDDEFAAVLTHELAHTAQDTRSPIARAFGAARDAVGNLTGQGAREMQGALPGDGQPPANLPPQVQRAVRQAQAGQKPGLSPLEWTRRFVGEVGYSSMIGPATFSVNVLGNMMEPLWAIPKEATRAIARGNPREFIEMAGGAFHGMGQVGTAMVDALASRGRFAATPGHEPLSQLTNNPIGKAITTGLEAGGRAFSALPDAVFGTIATGAGEARKAAQIATDMGLKGQAWKQHVSQLLADVEQVKAGQLPSMTGTQEVIDGGIAYAKRQTFQDELGTVGRKAREMSGANLPVVGNLITPFFNTPWNMNTRMLERTPAGFAMNSQGGRFDRMYDATVGSALLIGLAAGPVASGQITGGGPNDPQKKAEMRSQGWRPYSTLIDGVYVPNRVFGVYAPVMNAAADVHDSIVYAKDKSPASITSDFTGRIGQQIQQQPYLQGISNIMQAFQAGQGGGLTSGAENYAASTITRMVPYAATARTVGTALDPNERTVDRGKNVPAATTISQQVQGGVGLRGDLPIAQDVLGRPQTNPQQGVGAVFAKTSPEKFDPTIKAFQDSGVDIGFPKTTLTIDTIPVDLTPSETRRWQTLRGEVLQRFAANMTSKPWWNNPTARQAGMNELLQQANQAADQRLMQSIGASEIRRRVREAQQEQRQQRAS